MKTQLSLKQAQLNRLNQRFAPETIARLQEIDAHIRMHEKSLAYLQSVWYPKDGAPQRFRNYYRPTKEDRERLPKTVANLREQIVWLQREAEVLYRYGR